MISQANWTFLTIFSSLVFNVLGDKDIFNHQAQNILHNTLQRQNNWNIAKNVIIIVGDGMSLPTIAAARVLKGQKAGRSGIGEQMLYETFPHTGLARTYATDKYVPDSASTATAFLCGVKTRYEAVGVDDSVRHGDCSSVPGTELRCIGEWAMAEGKSVGLVTNMRVTHATPAPLYAHSPDRWWEYDGKMSPKDRTLCKDIARQLVEDYPGKNIQIEKMPVSKCFVPGCSNGYNSERKRFAALGKNVISLFTCTNVVLGGGREVMMPNITFDPECPEKRGKRGDQRQLIDMWKEHKEENKLRYKYVWNKKDFEKVDPRKVDYLLGLFSQGHMYDVLDRDKEKKESDFREPTLAEMTEKAIRILSKNPNGFFLLVEGGLIDKRHHDGLAVRAVSEALDLENAVRVALALTSRDDTLLVVTSDHSQGLNFVGYANVGQDIFGIAEISKKDNLPYTTLMYSSGQGYVNSENGRPNITGVDTADKDYRQLATVPRSSTTHGGEDVGVYAIGPMAHLFSGVYDQHYIAHAMAYAACIGRNKDHCDQNNIYRTQNTASHKKGFRWWMNALIVVIAVLTY